jgi:hypothetical protein
LFAGNPLIALTSTYPNDISTSPLSFLYFLGSGYGPGYGLIGGNSATGSAFTIGNWHVASWMGYTLISLGITILLVLLCLLTIKPRILYFATNNQKSIRNEKAHTIT